MVVVRRVKPTVRYCGRLNQEAMATRPCLTYLAVFSHLFLLNVTYQTVRRIVTKKMNYHKHEDYTFEGELKKATGECSYIFLVNDTANRNKTIQMIKEKAMNRKVKEFYEEKEKEKQKGKEFYENVEKEFRRRIQEENENVQRRIQAMGGSEFNGRGRVPMRRHKRLTSSRRQGKGRRGGGRKGQKENGRHERRGSSLPAAFSTGSFTDHNNCSSRCIFARMEIVNSLGYPDESLIVKLIDDRIVDARTRLAKKKKVSACFGSMQKVAYVDSCIVSAKLFECLEFGESYLWSNRK